MHWSYCNLAPSHQYLGKAALARPSLSHPCDPNPIYLSASDYRVYEKLKHWSYTMKSAMQDGEYILRGNMKINSDIVWMKSFICTLISIWSKKYTSVISEAQMNTFCLLYHYIFISCKGCKVIQVNKTLLQTVISMYISFSTLSIFIHNISSQVNHISI